MDWEKIKYYIDFLRTDQVMQRLQESNIDNLSTNPWFLGGFATIVLITYFIGWHKISGALVGIGGFALVLSLAVAQGTGVDGLSGSGIWILIGGGVAAASLFIYMVFIKSD